MNNQFSNRFRAAEYLANGTEVAQQFNTVAIVLVVVLVPLFGWVSDRFIRRTHALAIAFAIELLVSLPLFLWMNSGADLPIAMVQIVLGILIAIPCSMAPSLFVELFPTNDRLSGYSIAFNLGLGVVGGSTPMISTFLIDRLGTQLAPAFYLSIWAIIGIIALVWMKDRSREQLR